MSFQSSWPKAAALVFENWMSLIERSPSSVAGLLAAALVGFSSQRLAAAPCSCTPAVVRSCLKPNSPTTKSTWSLAQA